MTMAVKETGSGKEKMAAPGITMAEARRIVNKKTPLTKEEAGKLSRLPFPPSYYRTGPAKKVNGIIVPE